LPFFLVAVHSKAGVANIIAITEKLDRRCELDQHIGVLLSEFNRRVDLVFSTLAAVLLMAGFLPTASGPRPMRQRRRRPPA
jgi:hypothetical protein